MARALNAQALTTGGNILFGKGEYSPETAGGKRLIAHELAHVLQQSSEPATFIQRKLQVKDPADPLPCDGTRQNWQEIDEFIRTLSGDLAVESSGIVKAVNPDACRVPTRVTDRCLCEMSDPASEQWTIEIDDDKWPVTERFKKNVIVHSRCSLVSMGAWGGGASAGERISQENWRILAHELCGHAWLMKRGVHPPAIVVRKGGRIIGRPSHDPTVAIENIIAGEVKGAGAEERGMFRDPHHGESFGGVTISGYETDRYNAFTHLAKNSDMKDRADAAVRFLRGDEALKADVIGHADRIGNSSYNKTLSLNRAASMREWLRTRGIDFGRMNVSGKGYEECPTPAGTPDPECRKVEIYIYRYLGAAEKYKDTGFETIVVQFAFSPRSSLTALEFLLTYSILRALPGVRDVERHDYEDDDMSVINIIMDLRKVTKEEMAFTMFIMTSYLPLLEGIRVGEVDSMALILWDLWLQQHTP